MRSTVIEITTAVGRGLLAALGLGCLSVSSARSRAFAAATPAPAATGAPFAPTTPATHVVRARYAVANAMKDQGTRPPRALAALH